MSCRAISPRRLFGQVVGVIAIALGSAAAEPMADVFRPACVPGVGQRLDPLSIWAAALLRGYQARALPPMALSRCPFEPSCSHFAQQALAHHGAVVAALLTADRLFFREHQHLGRDYPLVDAGRGPRYYDPP